jgi:phospholipid/cholesterol/gamma-HCH transport system ATP-binding protein
VLRIENLSVRYGAHLVLDDITLDFPDGQTTAIMGASGGGKTTLLRCLARLQEPTSGRVLFNGDDITHLSEGKLHPYRERMGFVFQYAALFDYLTVRENVAFGAQRLTRMSRKRCAEIVEEMLRMVGLEGNGDLYPSQLSGGMRKRVGLARAIATQPEVLLYDEPTSGLDPVTAYSIDALVTDLKNRLGVTSVVVSHEVNSVFRVADRIAVLVGGRVVELGDADMIRASREPAVIELLRAYAAGEIAATEGRT